MTAVSEAIPARRARAPKGEGEKLREEILAAAQEILVAARDESALSIRAIASAVGITPPSIYLHFADRNELVFAVCERQARQLHTAMDTTAALGVDAWDRIRRRGYAYLSWGIDNPEQYRVLMMGRPDIAPGRPAGERLWQATGVDAVASDLVAAAAEGTVSAMADPVRQAELFWVAIHGIVSTAISKPGFPCGAVAGLFDEMIGLFHRGLACGS